MAGWGIGGGGRRRRGGNDSTDDSTVSFSFSARAAVAEHDGARDSPPLTMHWQDLRCCGEGDLRLMRPPSAAAEGRPLTKFFPGIGLGGAFDPRPMASQSATPATGARGRALPLPRSATPASVAAPPVVTGSRVACECNLHVVPGGDDPAVLHRGSRAARLLPLALLALPAAPPVPRFAAPLIPAPLPVCWALPWRLWPPLLRGLWRLMPRRLLRLLLLQPLPSLLQRRRPWRWPVRGRPPPLG